MEPILVLRIAKTVIGLFGILGNGLVCLVIYRVKEMHSLTNGLICNQAAIDFLSCLFMLLHSNIPNPPSVPSGLAGKLYCQLWIAPVMLFSLLVASTFSLISITLERYVAIVYPFQYLILFTRRKTIVLICCVWIVAFGYKLNDMARYDMENGHCVTKTVSWKTALGLVQFCVQYFLPLSVMMFAYGHIMIMLRKSEQATARNVGSTFQNRGPAQARQSDASQANNEVTSSTAPVAESLSQGLRRARQNTFKTLLIVYLAFLVCWTPNQFIFLFWNLGLPVDNSSVVYRLTTIMASSNSAINFIIYALKYRQFRRGVRRLFGCPNDIDVAATTYTHNSVVPVK
ncbi:alpha-1B adrenergic receptor-like [Amphiura filiformis]|uniref:alpha-1B adrenergic receptor-like n=1 Tax=Amphiura filiformis TaxID=82378 RepID=UPI003B223072